MDEQEFATDRSVFLNKLARLPKRLIAVIGAAAMLTVLLIGFILIFPKQSKTIAELDKKREELNDELFELDIEKESLQELSSLSDSREYLIRYLRETRGYMYEGDIRIDLDDPTAVIPSPDPAYYSATAEPTASPEAQAGEANQVEATETPSEDGGEAEPVEDGGETEPVEEESSEESNEGGEGGN